MRRTAIGWRGVALAALLALAAPAAAQGPTDADLPVSLDPDALPPRFRDRVRAVTDRPTFVARGPAETFLCTPAVYDWLLDHPDQTSRLWRLIGVHCADVRAAGPGAFSWEDGQGSHIHWEIAERSERRHVWYAEGEVKAAALLPKLAVKAVFVADHAEGHDGQGHAVVRHRAALLLHTDSRAAAAAARLVGASAPHMAEQYLAQVETFFGAMAWYLETHPAHAKALTEQLSRPPETDPGKVPPPPADRAGGAE